MAYRWSAIALVLWACGSKDTAPTPTPPAPKKDAGVEVRPRVGLDVHRFEAPPVVLPMQREFVVLDAGKGTPRTLRYALDKAPLSYLSETKLTSKRLAGGTWGKPTAMSPVKNGLAITFNDPSAPLAARVLPGEVVGPPSPEATQYLSSWKALEGRRLSIAVDARGQLGAISFADDPDGKRSAAEKDELIQRLLATLIPLPETPVAVGAKWRVVTVLRQRPAIVKQTATYTLESMTADRWKITVQVRRIGESQLLLEPDLPKDVAVELVALVRVLEGSVEVTPKQVFGAGKLDVSSTIHIRASTRGRGQSEEIVEDTGTIRLTTVK